MIDIDHILEEILRREGGYVNDPDDPGGATNHGVTIGTMRRLGIDLNRDGRTTAADVKALTRDEAKQIYLREYFEKPRIDELPEAMQATVLDMNINAGGNSIKILQRMLNAIGEDLSVDGALGPHTIGAVHRAAAKMGGEQLRDAYGIERRNYYFRLADRRPASRKYAKTRAGGKGGWIKRAEEFMSPQYRMTSAQFAARTERWG